MSKKPSSAGAYAKWRCPECGNVRKLHTSKSARSVDSWCSKTNKIVRLTRV